MLLRLSLLDVLIIVQAVTQSSTPCGFILIKQTTTDWTTWLMFFRVWRHVAFLALTYGSRPAGQLGYACGTQSTKPSFR